MSKVNGIPMLLVLGLALAVAGSGTSRAGAAKAGAAPGVDGKTGGATTPETPGVAAFHRALAAGTRAAARSVGRSDKTSARQAKSRECTGTERFDFDGSFENGYAWSYGGVTRPYYGAFAEAFDLGSAQLNCASFWFTDIGKYQHQTMDVYVWDGGVTRLPGLVLAMVPGVDPGPVAIWPEISRHDVEINVQVPGEFAVGYWGNWPGQDNGWFVAADLNGWGGHPWTMIAPGIGYPTGWNDPSLVWGPIRALGIGVTWDPPGPPGACCDPATGDCHLTSQAGCQPPGEWQGEGTECDPNPCPPPTGACCDPATGNCAVTTQAECQSPNVWQGAGTTCSPNPCPQPQPPGACCHADGSCTLLPQAQCPDYWLGPGTDCVPNPCPPAGPHTLYVDPSGHPSTYPWFPNIQAALSFPLLQPGDEIRLMDGVFQGEGNRNIDFLGRPVTLRSHSGNPAACVIDGGGFNGQAQGFFFVRGETSASVLEGVTIANFWRTWGAGVGIYISGASPTIRNCRIQCNVADGSEPGGIYANASNARIIGCVVADNAAGGYHGMGGVGGIYAPSSNLTIESCTIAGNQSLVPNTRPGGLYLSNGSISRTIIWGNCGVRDFGGEAVFTCCDVVRNGFDGGHFEGPQVYTDPLFCAPPPPCSYSQAGDYRVQADSPCLPEHNLCGVLIGALESGCPAPASTPEATDGRGTPASLVLNVRPNPSGGVIRYEFGLPGEAEVRAWLYDAGGRLVWDSGESRFAAGTHARTVGARTGKESALPQGVYFLQVQANDETATRTLVLTR